MVTFSSLLLALTAIITGSLAAPADLVKNDVIPDMLDLAKRGPSNFVIDATNSSTTLASLARRGSAINYNQDYTTGGTVDYYHSGTGFQVNWNTQNDFVVGIGWSPGSNTPINFGGQFSVYGGTGLLSVYGWSTNPLVEYYIIEDYANPPSFGTQKGTVYSDGGTYVIWENTRYNAPSIEGTSTFNQYISVRQSPRTEGIVTVQNHFNAWAQHGMNLGALNYQVVAVEGWGGSGTASYAVNNN